MGRSFCHVGRKNNCPVKNKNNMAAAKWEDDTDKTLQHQAESETYIENSSPECPMFFVLIQNAEEGPHAQSNEKSEHDIGDKYAGEYP